VRGFSPTFFADCILFKLFRRMFDCTISFVLSFAVINSPDALLTAVFVAACAPVVMLAALELAALTGAAVFRTREVIEVSNVMDRRRDGGAPSTPSERLFGSSENLFAGGGRGASSSLLHSSTPPRAGRTTRSFDPPTMMQLISDPPTLKLNKANI
jgi:hypothetical protein